MKLVTCVGCSNQISPNAKACPQCGEPLDKKMGLFLMTLISTIVISLLFFSFLFYSNFNSSGSNSFDDINYDGTYNIRFSKEPCQKLGFSFKVLHSNDGHSDLDKMYFGNCKRNVSDGYEGYIYPKDPKFRHLRVFWISKSGEVYYK
jgi:hypothetical protein